MLASRLGLSPNHVARIRAASPRDVVPTRKERFQLEVLDGGWRAACMDDEEWTRWVRENPMGVAEPSFADRPCRDCPMGFAADMRAIGRCNGRPSGTAGEPADHSDDEEGEDEGPMLNQNERPSGGVRGAAPLELVPPPCATCAHEPVCVLKIALRKATSAEVSAMSLPDGLSVVVTARVDCRFYDKARKVSNRGSWSPERRAAQGDRMRQTMSRPTP